MIYTAHINIMPLTELLDPQGKAVNSSLHNLGLNAIQDVRIGKHITLSVEAESKEAANTIADQACQKMLCNAVMEKYSIVIE
ncbi:MAG TPA: phosphoribosylformylglycinamidine synthase subunit PurS [Chitinophagaceae bacterium]|nr:phosphoribosylformylglycinamidine synthase subunit PurS [Chitinophagaceae bacterium]HPI54844.1 phosphoribosylformylglycinamidine synthase subunit PurS [Chitinophagaceae bacterium]